MLPLHVVQLLLTCLPHLHLSPTWTWGLSHQILKISYRGYSTKDMHPMFVIVLAQCSLTKLDTMSNFIKEGYFNLSTMLNLKSLWMYQLNTSKPEHKSINNGSMNFKVQAMFKWRLVNSGLHTWVHLPPACRTDVLILLQRWHVHVWLSMTPPCLMWAEVEDDTWTMLTQVTARLGHTHN